MNEIRLPGDRAPARALALPKAAVLPAARRRIVKLRPFADHSGALALYAVLAVFVFSACWFSAQPVIIGMGNDPNLFRWDLHWVPFAISHGENPLITSYLHVPEGANLLWDTSILLPALLLSPITTLLGAATSYNLLSTAALVLSAWCAYFCLARLTHSRMGALVGGLLYGFSPFMIGQALGHLHMTIAVFPPLAMLLLFEIVRRQKRPPILIGALLGALAAAQLLTGEEVLALTAFGGALCLILLALLRRDLVASRVRYATLALAAAALMFLLLAGYPLVVQFFGPQHVSGRLQPWNVYVSDLLTFVVPDGLQHFSTASSSRVVSRFTGNIAENDAYLGVPLLVLLLWIAVRHWDELVVRFAALATVVLGILSLGPTLHVGGRVTSLPLPGDLFSHLPVVEDIIPSRFALLIFLLVALVLAVFIGHVLAGDRWQRIGGLTAVALALAPLLPIHHFPVAPAAVPAFFSHDAAKIPAGSVVVVAPFRHSYASMTWQAESGMHFRMLAGAVFNARGKFEPSASPLLAEMDQLETGNRFAGLTADARQALIQYLNQARVTTVIVGPFPQHDETVRFFSDLLGQSPETDQGVNVWWNVERLSQPD